MDRLPSLRLALGALSLTSALACDRSETPHQSRQRVNAVPAAVGRAEKDLAAMCDAAPSQAPRPFEWPALTRPPPATPKGRWLWVNVWATWCKPCVEELPRLFAWQALLKDKVSLELVSADSSESQVAAFRKAHAPMPASYQLKDPDSVGPWVDSMGVPGATLPVHIFVDPAGNVRCVRASSLERHDLPALKALLESR